MKYIFLILTFIFPIVSSAQYTRSTSRFSQLLLTFGGLIGTILPVIFGLAMIYFFWGTANFILKDAGNEKTRRDGLNKIIWGVVALFVFVSIWGILNALSRIVNI